MAMPQWGLQHPIWTPSCKRSSCWHIWVITYGHKTQSLWKTEVSKSAWMKPCSFMTLWFFCQVCHSLYVPLLQLDCRILGSSIYLERSDWYLSLGVALCASDPSRFQSSLVISITERDQLVRLFETTKITLV